MASGEAKSRYEWLPPRLWRKGATLRYTIRGDATLTEPQAIHLMIISLQMRADELNVPESPFHRIRTFMRREP